MAVLHRLASRSAGAAPSSVRPLTSVTSTVSPGAKASVAPCLPAFALGAARGPAPPASRGSRPAGRASPARRRVAALRRARQNSCRSTKTTRPKVSAAAMPMTVQDSRIAGRLDLEQHRRAEQKGGEAAEPEDDGRVEGLDDQEGDARAASGRGRHSRSAAS